MKNRPFHQRLGYAIGGILAAARTERSFRTQLLVAIAVLGLLAWLRPSPVWWGLLLLTIGAVLAAELLNTAIEHLADLLHPEQHPAIKAAKDAAAGAVLVMSLTAVLVAAAFLVDYLRSARP